MLFSFFRTPFFVIKTLKKEKITYWELWILITVLNLVHFFFLIKNADIRASQVLPLESYDFQ